MTRVGATRSEVQIIVVTPSELDFFESRRAAEQYMEAVDVDNGEYVCAYDRLGQRFSIVADTDNGCVRNVHLINDGSAPDALALDRELRTFLTSAGIANGNENLEELLKLATTYGLTR